MSTLKTGNKAPVIRLSNQSGEKISLADFKGKNIILYFYPKDMTLGCTQEACDFRDETKAFQKKNAVVLGVSRDSVERHGKFADKYELNFSLLADVDGKASEAYGVWKEKSLYGRKFMGIERTTFWIGVDGKIKKIYPKVKVKGHVAEILSDLN